MSVITVSRQYASGGSEVARIAADRLGWTLVDNEFIDEVAARVGLPPEQVAELEERVAGLIERLAKTLAISSPEVFLASGTPSAEAATPEGEIVRITETVIAEAVQHDSVVMVGRGAQAYLAETGTDALHVYIVAPLEVRVERAMERLAVSRKEAEKTVAEIDDGRRHYVQRHYQRRWDDPANYHLVLNSGLLSYEECAGVVAEAARR